MSEAASDLLQQMKQEQVKQTGGVQRGYYSKILVNKTRQRTLAGSVVLLFISFSVFLYTHQHTENHWFVVAVPIIFLGSLLTLISPTEEWMYSHWQTNAQKYERHFLD